MRNLNGKKRFYICCRRGCPRRSLDSARIWEYLSVNGWEATTRVSHADLLVVYTCGGFQSSEDTSLLCIRQFLADKKESSRLVVTGCLLKINPNAIKNLGKFDIIQHEELYKLDDIIHAEMPYEEVADANIIPDVQDYARDLVTVKRGLKHTHIHRMLAKKLLGLVRSRRSTKKPQGVFPDEVFNLKIAEGCISKCSYCVIRRATGKLKSKPIEKIIEEFENGLDKGYKRFVLIAEDTGAYGLDIGSSIVSLLRRIFEIKKDFSLIINDFNAKWLVRYHKAMLPMLQKEKDRIEDIRIPIQSGSDRILKLMKRGYSVNDVRKTILDLKTKAPDLKIFTHIMVGFPGETDLDFEQSAKLIQDIEFSKVSIYSYEDRPGTKASLMPDKISEDIKDSRLLHLKGLCDASRCNPASIKAGFFEIPVIAKNRGTGHFWGYNQHKLKIKEKAQL